MLLTVDLSQFATEMTKQAGDAAHVGIILSLTACTEFTAQEIIP